MQHRQQKHQISYLWMWTTADMNQGRHTPINKIWRQTAVTPQWWQKSNQLQRNHWIQHSQHERRCSTYTVKRPFTQTTLARAALTYSVRGYDSLFAAAKCHVMPSWVQRFTKQIKCLNSSPLWECVCLQDGGRSRQWIANVRFILLFCIVWVLTASIFVYVCFVDCCIAVSLQTV